MSTTYLSGLKEDLKKRGLRLPHGYGVIKRKRKVTVRKKTVRKKAVTRKRK